MSGTRRPPRSSLALALFASLALLVATMSACSGDGGYVNGDGAPPSTTTPSTMDMTQPCAGLACQYYPGGACYCSCGGYPPLVECGTGGSCNCDNVKIVNGGQCANLADATRIYFLCLPY